MKKFMLFALAKEEVMDQLDEGWGMTGFYTRLRPGVPVQTLFDEDDGDMEGWFSMYWKDLAPYDLEGAARGSMLQLTLSQLYAAAWNESTHIAFQPLSPLELEIMEDLILPARLEEVIHLMEEGSVKIVLCTFNDSTSSKI